MERVKFDSVNMHCLSTLGKAVQIIECDSSAIMNVILRSLSVNYGSVH